MAALKRTSAALAAAIAAATLPSFSAPAFAESPAQCNVYNGDRVKKAKCLSLVDDNNRLDATIAAAKARGAAADARGAAADARGAAADARGAAADARGAAADILAGCISKLKEYKAAHPDEFRKLGVVNSGNACSIADKIGKQAAIAPSAG